MRRQRMRTRVAEGVRRRPGGRPARRVRREPVLRQRGHPARVNRSRELKTRPGREVLLREELWSQAGPLPPQRRGRHSIQRVRRAQEQLRPSRQNRLLLQRQVVIVLIQVERPQRRTQVVLLRKHRLHRLPGIIEITISNLSNMTTVVNGSNVVST